MGFAIRVDLDVESHRVAADGAVLDVVLVRTPGDIHGHHDFFAAGVADIRSFKLCCGLSAAAFGAFLGHGTQKCSRFNRVEFLSRMGDMATLLNDEEYFSATQVVKNLCVASEDRLPTKDEYEAALKTLVRIENEKGVDLFHAISQEQAPPTESAQ